MLCSSLFCRRRLVCLLPYLRPVIPARLGLARIVRRGHARNRARTRRLRLGNRQTGTSRRRLTLKLLLPREHATEGIESVLYKKAKGGDLLACIFWLKSHKPSVYNRKQIARPDPLTVEEIIEIAETARAEAAQRGIDFAAAVDAVQRPDESLLLCRRRAAV
jgi:hypothetical protein